MSKRVKTSPIPRLRPHPTIVVGVRFTMAEADKLRRDAALAGQTLSGRIGSILRKAKAL